MTEEQIQALLAGIISAYGPRFGRALTRETAKRLALAEAEDRIESKTGGAFAAARTALAVCGTILEEREDVIAGVILSGAANRNPACLLLRIEGDAVHVRAFAKEGLIKQHTAERAAAAFRAAFAAVEAGA